MDFPIPTIRTLAEKKLIGIRIQMSISNNLTGKLWKTFMSKRKEIANHISSDLISMQVYKPSHFVNFNPQNEFEKWATAEVSDSNQIPLGMESFCIETGLYAVFNYKGLSSDKRIFQYIFTSWLPTSKYVLDNRPHFEILGEKYRNNDPNSEEEIWIPIKIK